jgi:hypothetical protein
MKAHFLLLAIACMLLSSCVKEKNTSAACHYDKPLEQIEWLRTVKNDLESSSISSEIYSYNFGGNDYFQINYCKNCFDSGFTIYDCNRKVICDQGGWAGPNQRTYFDCILAYGDAPLLFYSFSHHMVNCANPIIAKSKTCGFTFLSFCFNDVPGGYIKQNRIDIGFLLFLVETFNN